MARFCGVREEAMPDNSIHEMVREKLRALPEEMQEFLLKAFGAINIKQFSFKGVVAGDCPVCGSFNTLQGSETPLGDSTIGICLDCLSMSCLECGDLFEKGQTRCRHWNVCDECKSNSEKDCTIPVWQCSIIAEWKKKLKGLK